MRLSAPPSGASAAAPRLATSGPGAGGAGVCTGAGAAAGAGAGGRRGGWCDGRGRGRGGRRRDRDFSRVRCGWRGHHRRRRCRCRHYGGSGCRGRCRCRGWNGGRRGWRQRLWLGRRGWRQRLWFRRRRRRGGSESRRGSRCCRCRCRRGCGRWRWRWRRCAWRPQLERPSRHGPGQPQILLQAAVWQAVQNAQVHFDIGQPLATDNNLGHGRPGRQDTSDRQSATGPNHCAHPGQGVVMADVVASLHGLKNSCNRSPGPLEIPQAV